MQLGAPHRRRNASSRSLLHTTAGGRCAEAARLSSSLVYLPLVGLHVRTGPAERQCTTMACSVCVCVCVCVCLCVCVHV